MAIKEAIDYLTTEQREVVIANGFEGILSMKPFVLDAEFLYWLVANFDWESRTLQVHGQRVQVSVTNVTVCFKDRKSVV